MNRPAHLRQWLAEHRQAVVAVAATLLFAVANSVLLLKDFYYLSLLPLAGLAVLLFVVRFEEGLLCMALLTPFAVNVALVPKMELSMPVEPMMILCTLVFLFRVLASRSYDLRLLRHPVALCLLASLAWMAIASCFSSLPLASFKYLLARVWFVVPFFFAAAQIFRDRRRIRQFFWCYAIGLIAVVVIATAKTLGNFSDLQTLHRVMRPFYNDHTAYGCVIALFLPAAFHFIFSRGSRGWQRLLFLSLFALLIVGLFFSYCRAAWLSVLGAIGVYALIRMGVKVKWMVLLFGLGVGVFFIYQSDVLYKLGKNHQDSSYDLSGQIKSMSNISTDASNLERLNRWASAMRMWREHPVLGTGPGTYQFLYASYQRSYQLSTISTNAGNLGNAHSEYIGPMTEQGIPGVLMVVCLFMATFATGVRVYRTAADRQTARLALAFTLSLLTYYIHGVFNNFLDTDKLSVPFWAFTAVIVSLDVYGEKKGAQGHVSPTPDPSATRIVPMALLLLLCLGIQPIRAQQPHNQPPLVPALEEAITTINETPDSADLIVSEARKHLGKPYRFGGKGPKSFDCAGFTRFIYAKFGFSLPGGCSGQIRKGRAIKSTKHLQRGDLVFWQGRERNGRVGHTGIVTEVDTNTGTFRFIHAATKGGIIHSYSNSAYYARRYIGARRLLADRHKPEEWIN